jgi:hypothetical protein
MEKPMRTLYVTIIMLAASLGATAHAQLPFPFEPEPDFSRRPQCTKDYVRSVERKAATLEKLRTSGPEAVGQICTLIERGSTWLGGENRGLQRVTELCRAGQDGIERELMNRLARLKSELLRCDDTI